MTTRSMLSWCGVLVAAGFFAACQDAQEPLAPKPAAPQAQAYSAPVIPGPLNTVSFGARSLTIWPWTADDVAGQLKQDPINILIPGQGDPRRIREVLLALAGDRSPTFPNTPPFNCVWKDAILGGNQTAYVQGKGWVGSAIQLTCGDYTMRYHLRLFPAGSWTIGGAHFEVQIPGLPNHAPLSWDAARDLVVYDFARSGLLDPQAPMMPVDVGSGSPTYRTIEPADIYFGLALQSPELAAYVDAVVVSQTEVRIKNGPAMLVNFTRTPNIKPMAAHQEAIVQLGQYAPQQFCGSSPTDYFYITGPMKVTEDVLVTLDGTYISTATDAGTFDVTPVNIATGQPRGAPFKAAITEVNTNYISRTSAVVTLSNLQAMPPGGPDRGTQLVTLRVGPGTYANYNIDRKSVV